MIAFLDRGDPSLLILSVPEEYGEGGRSSKCFALPVLSRTGGLLLCVPRGCLSEELLVDMMATEDSSFMIGSSKGITVSLVEEGGDGQPVLVGAQSNCLIVDFSNDVLPSLHDYDPAVEEVVVGFSETYPGAIPMHSELLLLAQEWVASQGVERVNFYSAQEEPSGEPLMKSSPKKAAVPKRVTNAQVLEQVAALVSQVKVLAARQDQMERDGTGHAKVVSGHASSSIAVVPPVSAGLQAGQGVAPPAPVPFAKVAKLIGPPPKIRPPQTAPAESALLPQVPVPDPEQTGEVGIAQAISQQSTAITALVAHLTSGSDPLAELQVGGGTFGSTKGVQRREKMQADLAAGTSQYYLAMMQQVHRRLFPAMTVPKDVSQLQHLSFLTYMKETGGYKACRETGLVMWLLGHIIDAASQEDLHQVRERLALLAISLEQSAVDRGDWQIAYLLSLAEDPPLSIYQDKTSIISPYGRPFASLVPSAWSAVVLAYVKELEVLTSKKGEATSPKKAANPKADPDAAPSPKRKTRFPRRVKADPEQQA